MSTVRAFRVSNDLFAQELEELFRNHAQLVYRTAYSITASAEDAEDVVQTLFLNLLRRGSMPALQENPKGYLYRSAVNHSLNIVRSRKSNTSGDAVSLLESQEARESDRTSTEQEQKLISAMSQLDPGIVEMLILRYEHDYSDAEIAGLLGKSRGVVAVTLFRARARLKRLLMRGKS
jgi:RNA polymerase sigma-70 factor (ECF subfamily)